MAESPQHYLEMYEDAESRGRWFVNLWQETQEYTDPVEGGRHLATGMEGQPALVDIVDTTAVFDSQDMASGLSSTLVPPGQPFFAIGCSSRVADEDDESRRFLARLSEETHEAIFGSNFVMQFGAFLRSWCNLGEAAIFSEAGDPNSALREDLLNFREFPAGTFHYLENHRRVADAFLEKFEFSARQAVGAWGQDKVGTKIWEAASDPKRSSTPFEFVHVCQPRRQRDHRGIDTLNYPYEDVFVSTHDKRIVHEGGYEEFPYHIGRWSKSARESRGRGIGVFLLPQIQSLNQMKHDLIECANRHNNPPREIGPGLEGNLDTTPGANNYVTQMGNIRPLEGLNGNFPYTAEMIREERLEVHRAYLIDVFNQLINLRGDRRTTLEISERMNEGLRRLSQPAGRLIAEVLNPMLTRDALLLIRRGVVGPVPPALEGKGMRIEYKSPLVLALKRHQAQAFMQWVSFVGQMEATFPGATDNVDSDRAIRDMGDAFGIRSDHKRSIRERDALRQQRASLLEQKKAQDQQAQLAQTYKQTTKAPQEGSLAGALMGAGVSGE